ncbi:hypothetical protein NEF87_001982 [Candidatus Lokiarchaeum ossiferum]|uniref:Methyltransferase n=1 Tax=Candidatus Lokiarchaeum ossiferum TaxID=2951803 RepID=A0ABY6HTJ4_9ARCH|nr:hypothetical protein NEF87_001982 [Candidatus Lokiarchaeum sp. B-35]
MNILQKFIANSLHTNKTIGIGINDDRFAQQNIHSAIEKIVKKTSSKVVVVGTSNTIQSYRNNGFIENNRVKCVAIHDPCSFLIDHLFIDQTLPSSDPDFVQFNAIVRGGLSSTPFLTKLRACLLDEERSTFEGESSSTQITNGRTYRLALLETSKGHQFFYGGVGIDEVNSYLDKFHMIQQAILLFKSLGIKPKIGILSGGRLGDIGRDSWIDQTIADAEKLCSQLQQMYPLYSIKHYQVLIEQAMMEQVNLLIAPEGIAGNLIYRTLVHLGNGRSYGALYLSQYNKYEKIIIDCSRVAPEFEVEGSLYFALGLLPK